MSNWDDAVRSLPPPTNPVICDMCGRDVPMGGDEDHEIELLTGPDGLREVSVICLVTRQ